MPHFIVECTDNIREQADLPGAVRQSERGAGGHGIFPRRYPQPRRTGSIRQMADGKRDYAFVHMTLKIGSRAQPGKPSAGG